MSLITAQDLKRGFSVGQETVWGVDGITLGIQAGLMTALRGRSGSGKTTLMNMLSTLDRPTEGTIFFDGVDITAASDAEREKIRRTRIGIVFQSVALISIMTAYENVEFALRIADYPQRDRNKRVMECLSLVGLQARAHHMPQELSGGEQQRVAIARGIAHKPDVVFADEPTAELDTASGLSVIKLFRELSGETTFVIATHDDVLSNMSDTVYNLEDGKLV